MTDHDPAPSPDQERPDGGIHPDGFPMSGPRYDTLPTPLPAKGRLHPVQMEAQSGCSRCDRTIPLLAFAFLDDNHAAVCIHCAATALEAVFTERDQLRERLNIAERELRSAGEDWSTGETRRLHARIGELEDHYRGELAKAKQAVEDAKRRRA